MTGAWWRRAVRAALGRRAQLRWVHLVLGGALLMPYYLLTTVVFASLVRGAEPFTSLRWQLATFASALPLAALTALFPLVRPLEATAARSLCGLPESAELATGPAGSWDARSRTSLWYALHLTTGGLVSALILSLLPAAALLVALPFTDASRADDLGWPYGFGAAPTALAPVVGLLLLAVVMGIAAGAGALLARWAPVLLGPAPAERLAAAERRAARLASRNRLARELHDSVGHALSAVTLQASAARKVLDTDPEFAREALAAIEETTRDAVGELDSVLGLLREGEDRPAAAPSPTLRDLDGLLARTRAAGVTVELTAPDTLDRLPSVVSREAYRIVQEGLSNALRHAGRVPVRLRIAEDRKKVEITMENPVNGAARARRPGGGRGLRGITERATLLRGTCAWDTVDGVWRLTVRLPVEASR
ncbi:MULTISPECIES: sensor histidine kinase [Streptomyces]|uniref:histidine kinase n=1 Tax=Streptomyces demainii TaxID=588122 RepID=A0ABT9KQX2_9ACTN|nr:MULTISPECIES: histidine kinase [Streptomyces]MBW8089006.1 two-component sensor histidine kinase [Streptomyces hygroscopicus subsp. hygroscopicus]MCO8301498.1 histidine kinase [Streptomyces sp. RKCA744]MDP9610843.1 signal transduction histidine kinase [Streptomyces demainii]GLV73930.1 histidine kinase [Streptomyces hygroscopicus subsp. hygroscopicus]